MVAFGSSLAGVSLSSIITSYFGYRPAIVAGYALMSAGLVGLNTSSYAVALLAAAAIGLGYGLAVPGTNLSVAEMGGKNNAGLVSLVNFAWGLGALSCSPLLLFSLRQRALPQLLVGVALFGAVLTLLLLFMAMPQDQPALLGASAERTSPVGLAVTAGLTALFFIYVGTEVSFSFWAATYANRLAKGAQGMSTVAPMFFFAGLMTGRALAPVVLRRVRESRLVFAALFVVAGSGAVLVSANGQRVAFESLSLAGLGCACLFPIYVAWLSRWYGTRAKRISALMFSMASLGGAAVPWVVGFVSERGGGLRAGLLVPPVNALAMILLLVWLRRQTATV